MINFVMIMSVVSFLVPFYVVLPYVDTDVIAICYIEGEWCF